MNMNKKKYPKILFSIFILLVIIILNAGCIESERSNDLKTDSLNNTIKKDDPLILPDWNDGEYHNYQKTYKKLQDFNYQFPSLVDMFSIGKSVLDRNIWCIRITNENNNSEKLSCLIDGCIHGNEWEAGEACLYISEYLIINFGKNNSVSRILNKSEIFIIPILNPDGREINRRWNFNRIDLNRNFDIDFGRLRGSSIRIGKILNIIKIPYIYVPLYGAIYNCGRKPFSEPESKALRYLLNEIDSDKLSFYLNCHTAMHLIDSPWSAVNPPFEMKQNEKNVYDTIKNWVVENTEYENSGLSYYASGTSVDWCYKEFRIPSLLFEMLSIEYDPWIGPFFWQGDGKHDHLVHWMKTTLPVFLYLFVNIENLNDWIIPDIEPILPDGIPPPPLY